MAAYAARAGMRSLVLIPEGKIAWGKLSQAMDYGAVTCQLKTDFDGCVRVLTEIVRQAPIYLLNSVNPYRLEGQKTPAFEIAEAFDWNVPDHLIVPGGNLGNSSALGKGFREMKELGLVARMPRISVIQAAGANPLVQSLAEITARPIEPVEAHTRATAIRIGNPASWRKAARVIQDTCGWCLDVSEAEIAVAKAEMGAKASAASRLRPSRLRDSRSCARRARWLRRNCGAAAHRPHAQGRRLHHRLPSRNFAERRREGGH